MRLHECAADEMMLSQSRLLNGLIVSAEGSDLDAGVELGALELIHRAHFFDLNQMANTRCSKDLVRTGSLREALDEIYRIYI